MKSKCTCTDAAWVTPSIGGYRCDTCKGRLGPEQILPRIIHAINQQADEHFKMIGGLQKLGADVCGVCDSWFLDRDLISTGDRVSCRDCFRWEWFVREEDDEETLDLIVPKLLLKVVGTPLWLTLPRDRKGRLEEPFLGYWKRMAK